MTFDPTKPVQTRDGRKVTIFSTTLRGHRPIGVIIHNESEDALGLYLANGVLGSSLREHREDYDLFNVPEETVTWHVPHPDGGRLSEPYKYLDQIKAIDADNKAANRPTLSLSRLIRITWFDNKPVKVELVEP